MTVLKKIGSGIYKGWMAFARILMIVNTTIILSIVYILFIGPAWLVMRIRGKDLLDRRMGSAESYWREKDPVNHSLEQSRHQF